MSIRNEIIRQIGWGLLALWPVTASFALLAFFELIVALRSLPPSVLTWIHTIGWGGFYVTCSIWAVVSLGFLLELVTVCFHHFKKGGAQ